MTLVDQNEVLEARPLTGIPGMDKQPAQLAEECELEQEFD